MQKLVFKILSPLDEFFNDHEKNNLHFFDQVRKSQVPPSLLNEDMLKIPHSIEESVMEGIKGIKKMYESDESKKKIGNKLSKMVAIARYLPD